MRPGPALAIVALSATLACTSAPETEPSGNVIVRAGTESGGELLDASPLPASSPLLGADEIRLENLRRVPTHVVGMVRQSSERFREVGSLPQGYKRVPDDVFQAVLNRFGELEFLERSRQEARYGVADIEKVIRRAIVASGTFAYVHAVPVKPTTEMGRRFEAMAGAFLDMYNRVDSLRYAPEANDPYHFEKKNIRLEQEARRRGEGS